MGMLFCSGLVAMMTWFDDKHLARAMGLCAAGSCVGGIVYVLIARELLLRSERPRLRGRSSICRWWR